MPRLLLPTAFVTGFVLAGVPAVRSDDPALKAPNPQMQAVLDQLAALHPKPIETCSPAEARVQPSASDAVKALVKKQGKDATPEAVGKVQNMPIPGPVAPIPVRVYTPKGAGPFPVLVYWHGGGWVIADLDTYDASCRALCNAATCVVVSCHYRQAPEHPFPAAEEDAVAAYRYVLANAAAMNGDPRRVAVGGESAGGNLAAVVALRARDGMLPAPAHQLLIYPVTDYGFETPSYNDNANAKPLNKAMMKWFWGHYLKGQLADATNAYTAPLKSKTFANLPPATIINADIDPLRDDGKMYADQLKAAGVKVMHKVYPGVTHEFFGMGAVVDTSKEAVMFAAQGLGTAFGK